MITRRWVLSAGLFALSDVVVAKETGSSSDVQGSLTGGATLSDRVMAVMNIGFRGDDAVLTGAVLLRGEREFWRHGPERMLPPDRPLNGGHTSAGPHWVMFDTDAMLASIDGLLTVNLREHNVALIIGGGAGGSRLTISGLLNLARNLGRITPDGQGPRGPRAMSLAKESLMKSPEVITFVS